MGPCACAWPVVACRRVRGKGNDRLAATRGGYDSSVPLVRFRHVKMPVSASMSGSNGVGIALSSKIGACQRSYCRLFAFLYHAAVNSGKHVSSCSARSCGVGSFACGECSVYIAMQKKFVNCHQAVNMAGLRGFYPGRLSGGRVLRLHLWHGNRV